MTHLQVVPQVDYDEQEEPGAVALLQQPDSVYALTEKAMTGLLAQFLIGAPDVSGLRIVQAHPWPSGKSIQIEVVDRYGDGRSFLLPMGRWYVEY